VLEKKREEAQFPFPCILALADLPAGRKNFREKKKEPLKRLSLKLITVGEITQKEKKEGGTAPGCTALPAINCFTAEKEEIRGRKRGLQNGPLTPSPAPVCGRGGKRKKGEGGGEDKFLLAFQCFSGEEQGKVSA